MEAPVPTVGRIVHYTNLGDSEGRYPPETQAAIITKVRDLQTVDLAIFYPTGLFFRDYVALSGEPRRGHWNWPPRV